MIYQLNDADFLLARVSMPDMKDLRGDFVPADWLADPGNMAITDGRNVALFEALPEQTWRGHWLLVDRGRQAFLTGIEFLRYIFVLHGALHVVGLVPAQKRASRWFTRQMGFISSGLVETEDGEQEFFSMTRPQFEARYGLFEIEEGRQQLRAEVGQ